jgi:ABC-type glycerol-3-phosphate transport system substrate-binding protein
MSEATNRTMSRRTFNRGVLAAAAAPALAAAAPLSSVRAQGATTVTFWQFSTDQFAIDAWNAAIAAFEQANEDVKVNMEIVPWADQHQKLVTGLTTGGLPDVSMLGNNVVAEFQALGALAPLTDRFKQWSQETGKDVADDIWPGDKLYYNLNGDWWASPVSEETRCLFYRKDLFEKAGVAAPPKTFAEARDTAKKLTQGDVYGWGVPGGIQYATIQTFMSVYLGYGARFLKDPKTCGFDSQEFREALTFYANLYTVDKVTPPDSPTYGGPDLEQQFQNGKLAMVVDGPWFWTALNDAKPDFLDQVGIAPIPAGPKGQFGFLGGWPLVLWKASKNPDAAWKWIKFATDPAGALLKLSNATGNIPGRKSIGNEAPWNEPPLDVFVKQMDIAYPYQYPDPEIPQMGTLEVDAVQTAVQSVMLGQSSVDDATASLVDRINSVLAR